MNYILLIPKNKLVVAKLNKEEQAKMTWACLCVEHQFRFYSLKILNMRNAFESNFYSTLLI